MDIAAQRSLLADDERCAHVKESILVAIHFRHSVSPRQSNLRALRLLGLLIVWELPPSRRN
jgi:hypothetical protein